MFEDIMSDYAKKTVTYEEHPMQKVSTAMAMLVAEVFILLLT